MFMVVIFPFMIAVLLDDITTDEILAQVHVKSDEFYSSSIDYWLNYANDVGVFNKK